VKAVTGSPVSAMSTWPLMAPRCSSLISSSLFTSTLSSVWAANPSAEAST
jgi:hypothetical protein